MMKKVTSNNDHKASLIESEIFYAIQHSQYNRLALFIRNKYNLNITSKDGRNGLFYALDINHLTKRRRMIRYCLDHGINPLQKEHRNGYTVLHETIARQQMDSFHFLLAEIGGEIDWRSLDRHGRTILHQAVESNNTTILEALVVVMHRYNVSVDVVDKNGLTPYLLATQLHLRDMIDILVKKGHASRQICDLQTHRTAREWDTIGLKENNLLIRQKLRQEMNDARRNGKINKVNQLKQIYYPRSSLSLNKTQRHDSYFSVTTQSGLHTKSSLSINEMIDHLSEGDEPESYITNRTNQQTSHVEHLPPINTRPQYRTHSSFNSLKNLFQIAQLS